jgi:hypothetical protein
VDLRAIVANLNIDIIHAIVTLKAVAVIGLDESDLGDAAQRAATSQNIPAEAETDLHPNAFTYQRLSQERRRRSPKDATGAPAGGLSKERRARRICMYSASSQRARPMFAVVISPGSPR